MTRTELAAIVRENAPVTRLDTRPIRQGLYAIAAALLLLAVLLLPFSILACEALYAQLLVKQAWDGAKK